MINQQDSLAKASKQLMLKNPNIDSVYFSYDELNIIGVLNQNVYVQGYYYDEPETFRVDCLLKLDMSLFKSTLDLWLKDKKEYCERWKEFCGVMGSIASKDFSILDEEMTYYDKVLRVISVNSIEDTCDMEHG